MNSYLLHLCRAILYIKYMYRRTLIMHCHGVMNANIIITCLLYIAHYSPPYAMYVISDQWELVDQEFINYGKHCNMTNIYIVYIYV